MDQTPSPLSPPLAPIESHGRRRRRYSVEKKLQIVAETLRPGGSPSLVARRHGIAVSQVFSWRRAMESGKLTPKNGDLSGMSVAEAKETRQRIRSLERMLGPKTEEVEVLREAIKIAREKKLISHAFLPGTLDSDYSVL